jgi:putative DNA primase/helicase
MITEICRDKGIKVLVLDNLGCLFCGVGENDADQWEKILPWLLELRRHGISVIIVHHSGHDPTRMRGTVKREDSAALLEPFRTRPHCRPL